MRLGELPNKDLLIRHERALLETIKHPASAAKAKELEKLDFELCKRLNLSAEETREYLNRA